MAEPCWLVSLTARTVFSSELRSESGACVLRAPNKLGLGRYVHDAQMDIQHSTRPPSLGTELSEDARTAFTLRR